MTKETQGQEKCYQNIVTEKENCESMICAYQCTQKWNGFGECVSSTSNTCVCSFNCKN